MLGAQPARAGSKTASGGNNNQHYDHTKTMKSLMILAAVCATAVLMTTGCATCHKDGACCKPAVKCDGSCCKDPATCAKCCKDEAGCAKCCKK